MKKDYLVLLIVALLIIGGLFFYWYEYRPYSIRKSCASELVGIGSVKIGGPVKETNYENCLHSHGL